MVPEMKDESAHLGSAPESKLPEPPSIHPSFIQVAKPYIFEQTIQDCIQAMGVNPMREESVRLQGVSWIDNMRKVLHLYVDLNAPQHCDEECRKRTDEMLTVGLDQSALLTQLLCITIGFDWRTQTMSIISW